MFDIMIPTASGDIYAIRFIRDSEIHAASTDEGTKMRIKTADGLLGHANEDTVRQVAAQLGWVITQGKLGSCLYCAQAKANQKNICKHSTSPKAT